MVSPFLTLDFWVSMTASSIIVAVPLIIASYGEAFSEQTGILNVSIEGYMLMGAMTGFATTFYTGNPWLGLLSGILVGLALSLVHSFISVHIGASQFVSGIGIVLFSFGLTGFWYRLMVSGAMKTGESVSINYLKPLNIPVLSEIPIIGPILFQHDLMVYIAFIMLPIFTFISLRTSIGLKFRAVGHNPLAAESLGVNAYRMRYLGALMAGALGGLGGAYLTVGYLHMFMDGITGGIGFVVLAIVIVGNWTPHKSFLVALLFGFIDALQIRLPPLGVGIPFQFLMMLPYIITILVLIWFRKISVPKTLALPYKRAK